VLDGLFHIAKADGAVTTHELAYLEQVSDLFGLSHLIFQRLRATYLGSHPDDPYVVLDVPADAPDETVRDAWKRALVEAHPDKIMARGLPAEFVDVAHAKAAAINAAFDRIVRERKAWATGVA
jgi:DnaJ like chaperone protein